MVPEIYVPFLWYILVAVTLVQIAYHWVIFRRLSFAKVAENNPKRIAVSVIICAKNEAENLKKHLPSILHQDYPFYEVVVIDDRSSDNTLEILEEFALQYPHLKLVKVAPNEHFWGNKKYALTLGIKAAKNPYLLFTDADCMPNSNQWISHMSSQFTMKKNLVLGYGAYKKVKGSWLNKIIRFDTLHTAIQYFGWAMTGKAYMGVGRNMAYHKDLFFQLDGFKNHLKILTGDDDLFVNEAATVQNSTWSLHPESFTISEPKTTYFEWVYQKRRHLLAAPHYKFFDKFQLTLYFLVNFLFFPLAVGYLVLTQNWVWGVPVIAIRYVSLYIIYYKAAKKLGEKDLIWFLPILELFLIYYQIVIYFKNLTSKPLHWKPIES